MQAGIDVRGPALMPHGKRTSVLTLLTSMFRLVKCCALERPHIIHFFLPRAYLIGAPLALITRVPTRVMSRRSLNNYQAKHPILCQTRTLPSSENDGYLGQFPSGFDQTGRQEQVPPEKLHLVYNGIPLNFYEVNDREEKRALMGLASDCVVLIVVANLVSYKGHAGG